MSRSALLPASKKLNESSSLLISIVQEVPHDAVKFLRFLSLRPMPALLHDVQCCVWDERVGSLRIGQRSGCILRAMHHECRDRDFVQPGGEIAAQAVP